VQLEVMAEMAEQLHGLRYREQQFQQLAAKVAKAEVLTLARWVVQEVIFRECD
jgi:hypothetical protein